MKSKNMKNIIILKDLPSNIVEEAFIFIKPNLKVKEYIPKNTNKKEVKKDYIVEEAESVIKDYIKNINVKDEQKKISIIKKKYKRMKTLSIAMAIVMIISQIINIIK